MPTPRIEDNVAAEVRSSLIETSTEGPKAAEYANGIPGQRTPAEVFGRKRYLFDVLR
jgi:hypothetical protein